MSYLHELTKEEARETVELVECFADQLPRASEPGRKAASMLREMRVEFVQRFGVEYDPRPAAAN